MIVAAFVLGMKLSASITLWLSLVLGAACIAYGGYGWLAIDAMPIGEARDDARGFAIFWLFLGAVGVACAVVSWLMMRGTLAEHRE